MNLEKDGPINRIQKFLSEMAFISIPSRDSVEIVFSHFDGDLTKVVKSFETEDASEILSHWKTKKTAQRPNDIDIHINQCLQCK